MFLSIRALNDDKFRTPFELQWNLKQNSDINIRWVFFLQYLLFAKHKFFLFRDCRLEISVLQWSPWRRRYDWFHVAPFRLASLCPLDFSFLPSEPTTAVIKCVGSSDWRAHYFREFIHAAAIWQVSDGLSRQVLLSALLRVSKCSLTIFECFYRWLLEEWSVR